MKAVFIASAVLVLLAVCVSGDDDYCTGPNDKRSCQYDECCVKRRWPKTGYECEDMGDEINDRCGGEYECGCMNGLQCVPDNSVWGKFRSGTGTCQPAGGYRG